MVGQEEINYSPYQVPSDIGMLSFFSPHATLLLFPFFSVKLTKSFFLDLRMFLKAATLVASLDKRENGSSKIQSYVATVCQYVFLLEMKS